MKTYVFSIIVEPDEDVWLAYSPALKDRGGATWGLTVEEAIENVRQVIQMTVESMIEHKEDIPEDPDGSVLIFADPRIAVTV